MLKADPKKKNTFACHVPLRQRLAKKVSGGRSDEIRQRTTISIYNLSFLYLQYLTNKIASCYIGIPT